MSNKDLFKEAIADAKAVREAALANAKVALEEALAPRLQNMISAKLQEIDEDLEEAKDKDDKDNLEEVDYVSAYDKRNDSDFTRKRAIDASQMSENEENLEEDFDLSEILAELSKEKNLDEAEEDEEEEEEEEVEEDEPEIEDEPEEDSNETITDLTFDELKDIIKDMISAEMGDDNMGDMGGEEEMAVNFDGEEEDEIAVDEMYGQEMEDDIDDEINLEELLAELDSLDEADDTDSVYEVKKKKKEEEEDEKDEMKEAISTINALRNELNEVNLLNAKLLYVNKIFKAKNLNESQKLKVIAQFDKATTAKEAKTIFESMNSAIAKANKSTLKESIGFASKAAGIAPKKPIVDETMSRWQMLAGITKY
jgi:hypothetical protein